MAAVASGSGNPPHQVAVVARLRTLADGERVWVFVCAVCERPVSVPLREVPWRSDAELPKLPHLIWKFLPARMMGGTFAVHTYPHIDYIRPAGRRYRGRAARSTC